MKSLLERAKARPSYFIGIVIAVIAFLYLLWWALSPSPKDNTAPQPKPSIITNQKITTPAKPSEASAPASTATNTDSADNKTNVAPASAPTTTSTATAPTTPVNAALPKDPVTAAEELDRLKDEQSRLKERKKELAKQLATSNKLIALKDQQLKDLGQTNP
ncbi:MAG: hypothetical protein KGO49_06880 [Gammaproteobacteria bacterium]|nr:hypothetical protein [Gammaproteobacteria bacterium]